MITIHCKNHTFSGIEAIVFDKDGTLEDSQPFLRELAMKRTRLLDAQIPGIGDPLLMAFGVLENTLDPAGLMAVGSRRENAIAAAAYIAETGRGWFEALDIVEKAFKEADEYCHRNGLTSAIFPDVLDLLKSLGQTGVKMAILSSDSTENVISFVQTHQLSPYIHLSMGADPQHPKPDPTLLHQTCEKLGVSVAKTLMIGDSQGDMIMAKLAQAAVRIGIIRHQGSLPDADITIHHLSEIRLG